MKKILVSGVVLLAMTGNTFAADFKNIEVLNNGTISLKTTSDLVLPKGEVDGDLKVLKDYIVSFAKKDSIDLKKVSINLAYPLEKNKKYTIIGIDGAEANMDFSISDKIEGEYKNDSINEKSSLKIEKVNIIDLKTIEIYYSEDLEAEEFIYRILSEIEVDKKFGDGENTLDIALKSPLEELTPYIILSSSVIDNNGKDVKLNESFYDFETKENLENIFENLPKVEEVVYDDKGNVLEVASKMKTTPQTGAETWLILLLTFILAGVFVINTKKA